MNPLISVIIPTHNPNLARLERTIAGLRSQSLPNTQWELLIVDNASDCPIEIDTDWHPNVRIIQENQLGLTRARLAGIQASRGQYLVFVDDDNVLEANYLNQIVDIFQAHFTLGAIGGKSLPEFEIEPEPWVKAFWGCLALRDLGETEQVYFYDPKTGDTKQHPDFAPIGAGMALQRTAALQYVQTIVDSPARLALDRTGRSLQSGGDCDINLTLINLGWGVGYFPQLELTHLISANRLTKAYLARLNRSIAKSWIQVLDAHQIRPWRKISRWSVFLRQLKAFVSYQPWKSPIEYIRWQGACGAFEGQSLLPD
ncbi:MAG: glycosyltransferase family 2 protein [Leptolyngbya sp. UWPOB_LEPTO1]|uniref:glycosyltransferase n=1 Tax=Leptolyngbya sp. UWPOB_LEPTO1 TaxID=2815653 RepID=UPI001AC7C049|nr:glycosyltransferase [Leptolyngbya sp. UWPOB_LEPTO1]MBN8559310.1 glycosyltransferase family 2 protein [Leptolyngbya sp. UWPOB_LEPTO1]